MRKIREILRLSHEKGLSHRAIAAACGMGAGTVSEYLSRAAQAGRALAAAGGAGRQRAGGTAVSHAAAGRGARGSGPGHGSTRS